MTRTGIHVTGLKDLRRDLKKAERVEDLAEFRDGLKAAAGIVADEAQDLASVFSNRAADTIRPTAGGNTAYVKGGKAALPWYGWADFGSRTPVQGNPRSVGPWAGSGKGPKRGRFIYEAIDRKAEAVSDAVAHAVDRALRKLRL